MLRYDIRGLGVVGGSVGLAGHKLVRAVWWLVGPNRKTAWQKGAGSCPTRVTPAEAGGAGAGRTLTLDRERPVRVPKTKPTDRGTPRPPPSAACTALRSAPNPYHGNGRHRAKTLNRTSVV